jgi:hypothetical protein
MTKPLHHFDKRILSRSIRKGLLSDEEYRSSLGALPDSSDNIAPPEPEEGSVEAQASEARAPRSLAEDRASEGAGSGTEPIPESGSGGSPVDPAAGGA